MHQIRKSRPVARRRLSCRLSSKRVQMSPFLPASLARLTWRRYKWVSRVSSHIPLFPLFLCRDTLDRGPPHVRQYYVCFESRIITRKALISRTTRFGSAFKCRCDGNEVNNTKSTSYRDRKGIYHTTVICRIMGVCFPSCFGGKQTSPSPNP